MTITIGNPTFTPENPVPGDTITITTAVVGTENVACTYTYTLNGANIGSGSVNVINGTVNLTKTIVAGTAGNYIFCCTIIPVIQTTGTLYVTSTPTGAIVKLDNVTKGVTPITINGVSAGNHTVEWSKTGYVSQTKSVTVVAGQTTSTSATLVTVPTGYGSIYATSSPTGASVAVDSVAKGTCPITVTNVAVGSRVVTFSLSGYQSQNQSVTVTEGATTNVSATMVATPSGNTIYVNADGTTTPSGITTTFLFNGSDETSKLNAVFDYADTHQSTYPYISLPAGKTIYVDRVDVHAGTYCYGNGCILKLHHAHGPEKILGVRGTVDGIKVDGDRYGVGVDSYGVNVYSGATLKNSEIYEVYGYVVDLYSSVGATVTNNYIHDCTQYGVATGGGTATSSGAIVTNNIIRDMGDVGIKIRGTLNATISGNTVYIIPKMVSHYDYDPYYAVTGIRFYTGDNDNNNVTVTNNTVVGNIGLSGKGNPSYGITSDDTGSSTNCTVTNNHVSNCDIGLNLGSLEPVEVVTGNHITNCSTCMSTYFAGNTCD